MDVLVCLPYELFAYPASSTYDTLVNIINVCSKHGAYLAGGAASELLRQSLFAKPIQGIERTQNFDRLLVSKNVDIDIFLRDLSTLDELLTELRHNMIVTKFHETIR